MRPGHSAELAAALHGTSPQSANVIAPMLVSLTGARSVVDVGCGIGAWIDAFERLGVDDLVGIDTMDEELAPGRSTATFRYVDLSSPFSLERTFDLALCLEVAEHLDARAGDDLVRSLVDCAPIVAFAAAIPHQGGQGHINEQWPAYWTERFANLGYTRHDLVRPAIWHDERVASWYRQNLVLYARDGWRPRATLAGDDFSDAVVHPAMYLTSVSRQVDEQGLGGLLRALPGAARRSLRARRRA